MSLLRTGSDYTESSTENMASATGRRHWLTIDATEFASLDRKLWGSLRP